PNVLTKRTDITSPSSCYVGPLALPSSPTRRSSDLRDLRPGRERVHDAPDVVHRDDVFDADLAGAHADLDLRKVRAERALREVRVDRKSTRLNSSHVKSSYAVFCLKKKRYARV